MPDWLSFVVSVLATYRASRLLWRDDFPPIEWCRARLRAFTYVHPSYAWLNELVSCPWCVSGWVSLCVTVVVARVDSAPVPVLWWLAVWGAAALVLDRPEWSDRSEVDS